LNAFGPGLYQIRCKANGKLYIGESNNVLDRLAKHTRNLDTNMSDCYELQKDWTLYGVSQFEACALYIGDEWVDREARLKKEKELIRSYSPEEVYNVRLSLAFEENYRVVCEIKGTRYETIADASRKTNERESKVRVKLFNNHDGYKILLKIRHGYESIIVNNKEYSSIMEAVAAGEAKDRFQAMRRLRSLKHKNWNYLSLAKKVNKEGKGKNS